MKADQRVSAPRRSEVPGSTAYRGSRPRFTVVQDALRGDPGLTTTRNPGNVGSNVEANHVAHFDSRYTEE
jgi:hypothetical protein